MVKQARLDESGFVRFAACTTCDLLLITRREFSLVIVESSSSEKELDSEKDDVEELSSSDSEITLCGGGDLTDLEF